MKIGARFWTYADNMSPKNNRKTNCRLTMNILLQSISYHFSSQLLSGRTPPNPIGAFGKNHIPNCFMKPSKQLLFGIPEPGRKRIKSAMGPKSQTSTRWCFHIQDPGSSMTFMGSQLMRVGFGFFSSGCRSWCLPHVKKNG